MTSDDMWNDDEPIGERFDGIDVPGWIDADISPSDVAAIVKGGCASGAYMPAVTYATAKATMGVYGDEIFDYIEEAIGEVPEVPEESRSWTGMACFYVSSAVELWAYNTHNALEALDDDA